MDQNTTNHLSKEQVQQGSVDSISCVGCRFSARNSRNSRSKTCDNEILKQARRVANRWSILMID